MEGSCCSLVEATSSYFPGGTQESQENISDRIASATSEFEPITYRVCLQGIRHTTLLRGYF
jgi:hypothetical protein